MGIDPDKRSAKAIPMLMGYMSPFLLAAQGLLGNASGGTKSVIRAEKKMRPCLCCGTGHKHNNAFCQPSCSELWKLDNPHNGKQPFTLTKRELSKKLANLPPRRAMKHTIETLKSMTTKQLIEEFLDAVTFFAGLFFLCIFAGVTL